MKSLLKDTMVYGISTVLGKFLNWMLTFLYARVLLIPQFGSMSNIYAWTAILMIVLTYGMETGFFRFVNKSEEPRKVYSTALWSLGITSFLFLLLIWMLLPKISVFLQIGDHSEYVFVMAIVVALDAFMSIPLAYLRYACRPWRFFFVRMTFIGITVLSTFVLFVVVPYIFPTTVCEGSFLHIDNRLSLVFYINLGANIVQLLMLMPEIRKAGLHFDKSILKKMLSYSLPILLLGLAGSFNNQADKILFPKMFQDISHGNYLLGIYSACYKLALVMVLFTQAFRYAYDPFIFAQTKNDPDSSKKGYSISMKYYIISTLLIFMGIMTSMDFLKYFVPSSYYDGLVVVPYVMAGQMMFGIYFNLAVWYKVTDRTVWGAVLSLVGCSITSLIIYLFAFRYGFMACALASVVSNAVIMVLSYVLGQHYYKIDYQLPLIAKYVVLTFVAYMLQFFSDRYIGGVVSIVFKWLILLLYICVILFMEIKYDGSMKILLSKISFFNRKCLKKRI